MAKVRFVRTGNAESNKAMLVMRVDEKGVSQLEMYCGTIPSAAREQEPGCPADSGE